MKTLLIVFMALLLSSLFNTFALADICSNVEQKSGLKLNEAECYVLKQVDKGEVAHFKVNQSWPFGGYLNQFAKIENRTLGANFLKDLLTGTLPNLKVTKEGVIILNAEIKEQFYLRNTKVPFIVSLSSCIFDKEVDFHNVRFDKGADFMDSTFYEKASFNEAKFYEKASFREAKFSETTDFFQARFSGEANFGWATFSGKATFTSVTFSGEASFYEATFSGGTSFGGATFSEGASFAEATFYEAILSKGALFDGANFSGEASFTGADFSGEASFTGTNFSGGASFIIAKFTYDASFDGAIFSGKASFTSAIFSEKASFSKTKFSGSANFERATFSGKASFDRASFSGRADFKGAQFSGEATFFLATFYERASFGGASFSGKFSFVGAKFFGEAWINDATFSGEPSFALATFSDLAYFDGATFSGRAFFAEATFSGKTYFSNVAFMKEANFRSCDFSSKSNFKKALFNDRAIFDDVSGFSKMVVEWIYSPDKFGSEKNNDTIKLRELKNHLEFNETFYIALIKNYRDMGWFKEADDCYYTYRVEKRKHLLGKLNESGQDDKEKSPGTSKFWAWIKLNGEYLLLDFTFGYGVKPLKILRTFLILWIAFSFYYVGFLRSKYGEKLPWWKAWNPIYKPSRFAWALLYSLDKLTPAIKLDSLKSLNPNVFIKQNSKRVIYVERIQNLLGWYWFALFLILFSRVWIR